MSHYRVRVPASTANLGPGFDCLGVAVDLYLELECLDAPHFKLDLAGEGGRRLPGDSSNLVVRTMLDAAGMDTPPPVEIHVRNSVPLARGLGSSSAAIVGGLALGRMLAGDRAGDVDRQRLVEDATRLEGHPDNVAPAIFGDLVVSGIEDGAVTCIKDRWPDDLGFVAVIPKLRISTRAARRALPDTVAFEDAVQNGVRLARLMASIHTGSYDQLATALRDRLHQPYRLPLATGLEHVLETMSNDVASIGAYLSGSGPTLMAITHGGDGEALGARAVEHFATLGVDARYRILKVDRHGLECED